jgi:hypothetical protein
VLDLRRETPLLAGRVDLKLVIGRGIVAAIAGIGDAAIEHVADERFHLRNDRAERVSVIRVAGASPRSGLRRPLLEEADPEALIGDKAYDADPLLDTLAAKSSP